MAEQIFTIVVNIFYAYASFGLLFAIAFAWRGVQKVDRQAAGAGLGFRCLILAGTIAFWPLLLRRWLHATSEPPEQENLYR
jgi:hypothetical protein